MEHKKKLTSVHVDPDEHELFQIDCIKRKFSFSKLVNTAIHLYLNDPEFKEMVIRKSPK